MKKTRSIIKFNLGQASIGTRQAPSLILQNDPRFLFLKIQQLRLGLWLQEKNFNIYKNGFHGGTEEIQQNSRTNLTLPT